MKARSVFFPVLAAALLLTPQHLVSAQEAPNMRDRPGPPEAEPAKMRMWVYSNLEKYLKLSEDTSRRFLPVFTEYSETRGKLMHEHMELTRKIAKGADDESVSIAELKALAQRYKDINRSLWQGREKFYKRSKEILDGRQIVKLVIFEDKMKDDLFKKFRESRKGEPPEGEMPPPPGKR